MLASEKSVIRRERRGMRSSQDQMFFCINFRALVLRIFSPEKDEIIIIVGQGSFRAPVAESADNTRQNQMHNAIIELTKRQDVTEKKHRAVSDQLGSVKRGINQRIQQDKKDSNDQTR